MIPERHDKVWGYEEWIVNGPYCGKRLHVLKGFRCSLHHHAIKDETFYLESGVVEMEVGSAKFTMLPGERVHVAPGVKHRFGARIQATLFEFSTHHEDSDSYRVEGELSGPIPRAQE